MSTLTKAILELLAVRNAYPAQTERCNAGLRVLCGACITSATKPR